jgi:hypothetical protein
MTSDGATSDRSAASEVAAAKARLAQAKAAAKAARPWYKKKRFWVLAVVVIAVVANAAGGNKNNGGSGGGGSTPANSGAALTNYYKMVNHDLSSCVIGIGATQIELGQALSTSATQSDYVNLYQAAKQAEGPCDIAQNNDLLNLGLSSPPNGYPSLANFSLDMQSWADSDSVTVLKDIENVANDPSSTAYVATLISDAQSADADAHLLNNQAIRAARQDHIKSIGGNVLLYWDLTTG